MNKIQNSKSGNKNTATGAREANSSSSWPPYESFIIIHHDNKETRLQTICLQQTWSSEARTNTGPPNIHINY